ncbi:MAG TPA: glycosyltransferase [Roseiarcus sp.]|nr:glycosyltransferase [Roseiarcus sp.]
MARFLWLNWSGGGNLPPSLGVARALTERGHDVAFAGRPEMVPRVDQAGFRAIELTRAYEQAELYPKDWPLWRMACYLSSPAVEEQVGAVIEAEAPDLLIVDQMLTAGLAQAAKSPLPTVMMCHTLFLRHIDQYRAFCARTNAARQAAGFAALPEADRLWFERDLIVTTSLASLDRRDPLPDGADKVRHVGPALAMERHAAPVDLPWSADDPTPLVLLSFSTGPEQGNVDKMQRTLDALAGLNVHVVATGGRSIDIGKVAAPGNAVALDAADHDALMARSALVVTHGGHGTMMRALKYGLPMLVMPGMAADQAPNAAVVEEIGAGRSLSQDASVEAIRAAAADVLETPAFGMKAREIARQMTGMDGALGAALEIEALLASPAAARRAVG